MSDVYYITVLCIVGILGTIHPYSLDKATPMSYMGSSALVPALVVGNKDCTFINSEHIIITEFVNSNVINEKSTCFLFAAAEFQVRKKHNI